MISTQHITRFSFRVAPHVPKVGVGYIHLFGTAMNIKNIREARDWFSVLQTDERTQTAVMTLKPGQSSAEQPESHQNSTQVLIVLKGKVLAELEGQRKPLVEGDVIVIPAQ